MKKILDDSYTIKKNYYSSCSITNISINTHEIHKCPRGEIGRHKGLKRNLQGLRLRSNYSSDIKINTIRAIFFNLNELPLLSGA